MLIVATTFDGDGVLDLFVSGAQVMYGVRGPLVGDVALATDATFTVSEPAAAPFPTALSCQDLDGDGDGDLIATSEDQDDAVLVFLGGPGSMTGARVTTSADVHLRLSYGSSAYFGSIAVGDLDGDGQPELALGTTGAVDVLSIGAAVRGVLPLDDVVDHVVVAHLTGGQWGPLGSVAVGDVDDDGHADLAVGAPLETSPDGVTFRVGEVFLLHGDGQPLGNLDLARAGDRVASVYGAYNFDQLGASLVLGDVDGDGKDDLLMGRSSWGALLKGGARLAPGVVTDFQTTPPDRLYANPDDLVGGSGYGEYVTIVPVVAGQRAAVVVAGPRDDFGGTRDHAGVVDVFAE